MLNNLQNYITRLSKFLTTTFFILLILTVLLQVFSRFFLVQAPPWTEELSRFFFIYSISFSCGLCVLENSYISINLIIKKFSNQNQFLIQKFIQYSIIIFMILIQFQSIKFLQVGSLQTSPSLGVNMLWFYFPIFIIPLSIMCFYIFQLFRKI